MRSCVLLTLNYIKMTSIELLKEIESWLSYLLVNEPSGFINHMLGQVDTDEAIQDIIFNQLLKSPRILKTYLEL